MVIFNMKVMASKIKTYHDMNNVLIKLSLTWGI